MSQTKDILNRIKLFEDLSDETKERLAKIARVVSHSRSDDDMMVLDYDDKIYLVVKGRAFLSCISMGGKKIIVEGLKRGDLIGKMHEVGVQGTDCVFLEPAGKNSIDVLEFDKEKFIDILIENGAFALRVTFHFSQRLASLEEKIEQLSLFKTEARLLAELAKLGRYDTESDQTMLSLRITHERMAEVAGVARETITKTLNKLETLGFISYRDRRIVINNARIKRSKKAAALIGLKITQEAARFPNSS